MSQPYTADTRLLREIRIRATRLLKAARGGDTDALGQLSFRVKRRHALDVVAQQLCGAPYTDLIVPSGKAGIADPSRFFECGLSAHWNHWFARYDEALEHLKTAGGYLFPFRNQFVIFDEHVLRTLGLDPDDPDWRRIGYNWARPEDAEAFARLSLVLCNAGYEARRMTDAK